MITKLHSPHVTDLADSVWINGVRGKTRRVGRYAPPGTADERMITRKDYAHVRLSGGAGTP